jgi:outer membrane protein TolC
MKKIIILLLLVVFNYGMRAQESSNVLSLSEYLGYVKSYHPLVKQANLVINESEAKLLKSRGAFDPKLEVDYDRKQFKNSEYFERLNSTFKIPTWYGVELKANFENNEGNFLNPEATVPEDGLYSVGVSVSLAKGLLINERMAMLKQAKLYTNQAKLDRQLMVNNIIYQASITYFNWLKTFNEKKVYESFLENAAIRFNGIKQSYESGERAAIDTLEARITLNNRKLELEKARITYIKTSLELSNYLWLRDNTPVELQENVIPDKNTSDSIEDTLNINGFNLELNSIEDHPKIQSLNFKLRSLEIEKRLRLNELLPQVDLQYNFLSPTADQINTFNVLNYKSGLNISFPLFLRKERGDLKLAKLEYNNVEYEIEGTRVALRNKIDAINQELDSFKEQTNFTNIIVDDYTTMLAAEERKFFLGESSLFLVNSRESKLIDAKLKAISLENSFFNAKANLFNVLGNLIL